MDDENGLFKYMISHLDEFRKKNDPEQVKQVAENILMYSLYSSRGNKYSLQKLNEVKANLAKLGVDKNSIRGRTWNLEATAYFKAGQADKAISLLDTLLKSSKPSPKEYQFICNYIKSRTSDKTALNKAAEWCKLGGN